MFSEDFINLSCANCGAKLDVYEDMERFSCGYCGTELVVQRRGGTVALKAVSEAIKKVQVGTDKTAAELALVRLEKELNVLNVQLRTIRDESNRLGSESSADESWPWISISMLGAGVWVLGGAVGGVDVAIACVFILVIVLAAQRETRRTRYKKWREAKLALDAQTESVKREIAQRSQEIAHQMEIVSVPSGTMKG